MSRAEHGMGEARHPAAPLFASRWLIAGLLLALAAGSSVYLLTQRHDEASSVDPQGPPWRYGNVDARFTVIEYADLECPHCKAYHAPLMRWINANPDVRLQWHHMPLSDHEPVASQEAVLAECAGRTGGPSAFWEAIDWIYAHTQDSGRGVPDTTQYPELTDALRVCLADPTVLATVREQVAQARRDQVAATPTLRIEDRQSGRHLTLSGPLDGDALSSALDLLSASTEAEIDLSESPRMPADIVSDMPQ